MYLFESNGLGVISSFACWLVLVGWFVRFFLRLFVCLSEWLSVQLFVFAYFVCFKHAGCVETNKYARHK